MTNIRLLLIEDDLVDQLAFKRLVKNKELNYAYCIASSLKEAKRIVDTEINQFDIVISDFNLGDGTAIEILDQIFSNDVPVIISTGSGDEEIAVKAMRSGAYDYLIKDPARNYLKVLPVTVEKALQHKKAERESKLLSYALKNIEESVYITDANDRFIFVNQAFGNNYGYSPEEILGKPVSLLNQQCIDHENCDPDCLEQHLINGAYFHGRKDHSIFPVSLSRTTIIDEQQRKQFVVSVIRDITQIKQTEQKLLDALKQEKELNELKNNFLAMVSHDFRNPISGIMACVKIIQDYGSEMSQEENHEYYEMILNSCDQMLQLLEDILLIGKTEAGKQSLNFNSLNLPNFAQQLAKEIQLSSLTNHKILFNYQGIPDFTIKIDQKALRHILSNLLSNAIKYSPDQTIVRFDLQVTNEQIYFTIEDQGIGINPQTQQHLFELFYRGNNVEDIPGTGLGLAIVKRYLDLLGGQIKVISELNMGTTFIVILPIDCTQNTQQLN
jgi:PAS domain S-box-containing protein